MGISNIRTVEAHRDSDKFHLLTLTTPEEDEELAQGYTLELTFFHDDGDEDTVLLGNEETQLLIHALDEWHYGA